MPPSRSHELFQAKDEDIALTSDVQPTRLNAVAIVLEHFAEDL